MIIILFCPFYINKFELKIGIEKKKEHNVEQSIPVNIISQNWFLIRWSTST